MALTLEIARRIRLVFLSFFVFENESFLVDAGMPHEDNSGLVDWEACALRQHNSLQF